MSNKLFIALVGILAIGALFVVAALGSNRPEKQLQTNSQGKVHELVAYKSPTCGCCGNWVTYMRSKGYKVDVVDTEDVEKIKQEQGIPESLYSCHTTIVNGGEYFIEGHIPEESIAKLLKEGSEIKGIGMPGMPSGSPGMPGAKDMPFDIMQVDKNKELSVFEVV